MAGERESQDQSEVPEAAAVAAEPGAGGDGALNGTHACFSTLDVTRVRRTLAKLHEQVTFGRGRVEIKRRGCDDVCVMISKAELEALEVALEIMSGSREYQSMCDTLSEVAAAAGGYATAGPLPNR